MEIISYLCIQKCVIENKMANYYLEGLNGVTYIARFMEGSISEKLIDDIKEIVTRCCERKIDELPLSDQEKEEQKRRMKQSAAVYNHGIKDGLRMVGKLT